MWLVMIVKTTDDGRIRAGIWIDPVIRAILFDTF